MKPGKRKKLEAAGWRAGSADEFLDLSMDESRQVTEAMPSARQDGLRVPASWTLEPLEQQAIVDDAIAHLQEVLR